MPPAAKYHAKTQLCQHKPKHQARSNECWVQLSSAEETDLLFTVQVALLTIYMFITMMPHRLMLILTVKAMANVKEIDINVTDMAVDSVAIAIILMGFLGLLCAIQEVDGLCPLLQIGPPSGRQNLGPCPHNAL
jgi:hypothetical protein